MSKSCLVTETIMLAFFLFSLLRPRAVVHAGVKNRLLVLRYLIAHRWRTFLADFFVGEVPLPWSSRGSLRNLVALLGFHAADGAWRQSSRLFSLFLQP